MTHSHERDDKVNDQVDDLNSGFCWGGNRPKPAPNAPPTDTRRDQIRKESRRPLDRQSRDAAARAWRVIRHVHDRVARRHAVRRVADACQGRGLISLFAYISSLDQGQAAQQIADKLGMPARHGAALQRTWRISVDIPSGEHTKKEVSSYEP